MSTTPTVDHSQRRRALVALAVALIGLGSCMVSWAVALANSYSQEPPYWVVWLTNRTLTNSFFVVVVVAVMLVVALAAWVLRGRRWWPAILIALGLVGTCATAGWSFNFFSAGNYHEDSIRYQGTLYRLSYAAGGRGWWKIWRCSGSQFDCHVIQEFDLSTLESPDGVQLSDRPRFAVEPESQQLIVTIHDQRQLMVETDHP